MNIKNESEINGETAKALRNSLGLNQKDFWGAVCVTAPRGCSYETLSVKIPPTIRRLVHLHYVVGIPTDITKGELDRAASFVRPIRTLEKRMRDAGQRLHNVNSELTAIKNLMEDGL